MKLRTSSSAPAFKWSHLWEPAIVNPVNLKSYTIPFLNLRDPYARAFHLSWLGFFVAFLSWFAFPPLIPDAIKSDLQLTNAQVGNSNIVALAATLVVRAGVGPLVDHYGPRKIMASILILGAIPSGLAGTAHSAETLYALRFFIGILGASFVPCQAWTSTFFDKSCVGAANALVGGWVINSGGATFVIMTSLFQSLTGTLDLSTHVAWRAAFVIVPVPVLLTVAAMVLIFGQDHPAGRWSDRLNLASFAGLEVHPASGEAAPELKKDAKGSGNAVVSVHAVENEEDAPRVRSTVDMAVNKSLTFSTMIRILTTPLTWLPALAYLTTFGVELAIDSKMADVLFSLYNKRQPGFTQTTAGYYTSIFGFLNIVTRPFGGYLGDVLYRSFGTKGKKIWTLLCGLIMGVTLLAGGFYLQKNRINGDAQLPILMGVFSVSAIFSEFGNGANFGLVPHCNAYNNGFMSGLVGSCGNLGGIIFALIFRFQSEAGKAFWIMGVICIAINALLLPIPVPVI
ncbi:Nitrate transporter [Leucoagaricus sp. SymC.cos]|nr:Nitrate transporter [Leucoagaricus sp. SymC.cos]